MTVPSRPSFGSGWIGLRFSRDRGGAPQRRGPRGSEERWAWLFIAPMVIGLAFLSAGPILATFGISLTSWDLLPAPDWVGLDNYTRLLSDRRFGMALRNTTFYTLVSVPLGMALSLGLALALNQALRGISWIRTMYFLPLVTSAIAVGLVWAWIYSPTNGLLNQFLQRVRHPGPEVGERSLLGDALDHRDVDLAGPAGQHDHLPRGAPGDPRGLLRRGQRRRRRSPPPVPPRHAAAAHAEPVLHRDPRA